MPGTENDELYDPQGQRYWKKEPLSINLALIPRDEQGNLQTDLQNEYIKAETKEPISRDDLRRKVAAFVTEKFDDLSPVIFEMMKRTAYENNDRADYQEMVTRLIDHFQIDQEFLSKMGTGYKLIETRDGSSGRRVTKIVESQFHKAAIPATTLLALCFSRAELSIHTAEALEAPYPQRFFFKSAGRYLAENDYGVKGNIESSDPSEGSRFVWKADRIFAGFYRNLKTIQESYINNSEYLRITSEEQRHLTELETVLSQTKTSAEEIRRNDKNYRDEYERVYREASIIRIRRLFSEDKRLLMSVLNSVTKDEGITEARKDTTNIAAELGLPKDPLIKYQRAVVGLRTRLADHLTTDRDYCPPYVPFTLARIASGEHLVVFARQENIGDYLDEVSRKMTNELAGRAIATNPSFAAARKRLGEEFPVIEAKGNNQLVLEFLKEFGADLSEEILMDGEVRKKLKGLKVLKALGIEWRGIAKDGIEKLLKDCYEFGSLGFNEHFQSRYAGVTVEDLTDPYAWLAQITKAERSKLFEKSLAIKELIAKLNLSYPHAKVLGVREKVLSVLDYPDGLVDRLVIPQDKLKLIAVLVGVATQGNLKGVGIINILDLVNSGESVRGIALVKDPGQYLAEIIKGKPDSLEAVKMRMSSKDVAVLTPKEIEFYYEHGEEFLTKRNRQDLEGYAAWKRQNPTASGIWNKEPKSFDELKLRMALSADGVLTMKWYGNLAELIGLEATNNYLIRMSSGEKRHMSRHDLLHWLGGSHDVEKSDLLRLINSIRTVEDSLLFNQLIKRYQRDKDQLRDIDGPIESIRDLLKRVNGIESGIDLSQLDPRLRVILEAPGVNLGALKEMLSNDSERLTKLLNGEYDKDQPFTPFKRLFCSQPVNEVIREALSQKSGPRKLDRNQMKLLTEVKQLIASEIKDGVPMKVSDLYASVPAHLESELIEILLGNKIDVGEVFTAELHSKSDPRAWTCGDYTDCCMPFGSEKNSDYMYNPGTQYFTISRRGRIIAQSVVVDGRNIRTDEDEIGLDNIEIADNYKQYTSDIDNIYNVFWAQYTSLAVRVGSGYTDLAPTRSSFGINLFKAKHELVYSDILGDNAYLLKKDRDITPLKDRITFGNIETADVKKVAALEAKTYPPEMRLGEDGILETLETTAEEGLPGAASSFFVRQGRNAIGYALISPGNSAMDESEKVIHIDDFAILPEFQGNWAAWAAIARILNVAKAYNGVLPEFRGTIEAEARESTSYALLMNDRVRRIMARQGFFITATHKIEKHLGNEDFYFLRIEYRPKEQVVAEIE